MTGGVVMVLGPLGLNFGSGMTGGLAYVLRAEADEVLHQDFVAINDLEAEEEQWLRRVLEEHLHFTGSPRASRMLSRRNGLAFVRVQPVHFQGSIADTWKPILAQLKPREVLLAPPHGSRASQAAVHA
jgi:glutamate synthase domain-containing protein 3